jgi:4-amino-4-deoxy-L-arabinose transferase-like glycosyltransferase
MFDLIDRGLTGRPWLAWLLLTLFCAALWLPGITTLPATDRDEARFAQASRQMIETGNAIDIRFQDTPRYKKPIGIYWLQAATVRLAGGEDPANPVWLYRIPSLFGALAAVLATWALGRRLFGAGAGFVAAALLASALLVGVEARFAKTDAALLGCTTVAMAALSRIYDPERATWRTALAFWLALGLGTLIKGPLVVVVVAIAIVTLIVLERRVGWLSGLRWGWGLLLYAVMVVPWFVAIIFASKGGYLQESVGVDLVPKLLGAQEAHGAPPLTYFLLLPVTFWSSSVFVLFGLGWGWRNRHDRDVRFLLAWLVPGWIMFELVPTKLPHYPLPFYPALALLAAAAFAAERNAPVTRTRFRDAILAFAALGGVILGIVLVYGGLKFDQRLQWSGVLAGVLAIVSTLLVISAVRRGARERGLQLALLAALIVQPFTWSTVLPGLYAPWIGPHLAQALNHMPAERVFLTGYSEPSAVIAIGTRVHFASATEAAQALAADAENVAVIDRLFEQEFKDALAANNITATPSGTVEGFNYSNGKRIVLTIWRRS